MTIREQAIRLCSIAACEKHPPLYAERLILEVEATPEVTDLADEAFNQIVFRDRRIGIEDTERRQRWAEAECLLRDGWSP